MKSIIESVKPVNKVPLFLIVWSVIMLVFILCLGSCGGNKSEDTTKEENKIDDAAFYETQPLHSGLYDADYYDITGPGARKGQFDGRIFFSLSPEMSAIYVFENGNRTKIENTITLKHPFEKGDNGVYRSVDAKDRSVTITPDSAMLVLGYQWSGDTCSITFNPKARYEASALDILEKITAQKKKR